jgi:hypothetical protein
MTDDEGDSRPRLHAVIELTLTPTIIPGVIHKTDNAEVARAGIGQSSVSAS